MKNKAILTMMMAALTLMWGCSSSHDDEDDNIFGGTGAMDVTNYLIQKVNGDPGWEVDMRSNDDPPSWSEVETKNYEAWAIYMLNIEPELAKYASVDDMMAIFVDGELRGFANPAITPGEDALGDKVYFILKVYGNENETSVMNYDLKYYNCKLRQLFNYPWEFPFESEMIYGVEYDLNVCLIAGSTKYPKVGELCIKFKSSKNGELQLREGDKLAVFVDDECRRVVTVDDEMEDDEEVSFKAFLSKDEELATLRYYSSWDDVVLTFKETFKLKNNNVTNLDVHL